MANKYGLICTEEAAERLWGGVSINEGQWTLQQGLWVYKVTQTTELNHFKFPTLDMIVICDNVSCILLQHKSLLWYTNAITLWYYKFSWQRTRENDSSCAQIFHFKTFMYLMLDSFQLLIYHISCEHRTPLHILQWCLSSTTQRSYSRRTYLKWPAC